MRLKRVDTKLVFSLIALVLVGVPASSALAQAGADGKVRFLNAYPTGDMATSVIAVERIAPAEVRLGGSLDYEIRVRNLTDGNVENVTLTEQLAADFKVADIEPKPASQDGGVARWNLGTLAAKATKVIHVRGSATKLGQIQSCNTVTFSMQTCQSIKVVQPA